MRFLKLSTTIGLSISLLLFNSCEEVINEINQCDFSYDKVLFVQGPPSQTQEISPNFARGSATGTFSSSDGDLALDPETGVIDVNASVPKEYTITFEGENTCETSIVIQEGEQECSLSYKTNFAVPGQIDFLVPEIDGSKASTDQGRFYAIPDGLAINETNGVIDVKNSESGVMYTIYYEFDDENTFCETELTIAGINYPDTFLPLENETLVSPVLVLNDGEIQEAPEGEYDPQGSARELGLEIDATTGQINAKETLRNIAEISGEFEPGFRQKYTVAYNIPGNQERELIDSSIEVEIIWYRNADQIPQELKDILEGRGIIVGKIEKRPPYILTVGDYE